MVVADWGTAFTGKKHNFPGGTPGYTAPSAFIKRYDEYETQPFVVINSLFAFGRIAMELYVKKSGTESKNNLKPE